MELRKCVQNYAYVVIVGRLCEKLNQIIMMVSYIYAYKYY